jgi:hypothetical protein
MAEGKNEGKECLTVPFTLSHQDDGHPTLAGINVQKSKICGTKADIHSFQFTPKFT